MSAQPRPVLPLTKIDSPHELQRTILQEARSGIDHAVVESELKNPTKDDITLLARDCERAAFQSLDQVVYCVVGKKIWILVTGTYTDNYRERLMANNETPHMELPAGRRHTEKRRISHATLEPAT